MKKIIFILTVLFSLKGYSSGPSCQILSDFLKQPHPAEHTINVSMSQMVNLGYFRHALARNYSSEDLVCTQVLVMSKNDYKYYRYFIRLKVIPAATPSKANIHYLYFQDASTQAFHNYFGKPWIGLKGLEVENYLSLLKSSLQLQLEELSKKPSVNEKSGYITLSAKNPEELLDQVKKTKSYQDQKNFLNPETLSFLQLDNNSYIVTWMTRISNSGNPFLVTELSQGYYLEFNPKLGLFEGFPYQPTIDGVKNKDGQNQSLYEHLEINLSNTQKALTTKGRTEHLFDLKIKSLSP